MDRPDKKPPLGPIRRVVTGHDSRRTAKFMIDAPATNAKSPWPGAVATLIWATDATPADISVGEAFEDMGARRLGTAPPANGTRFTINDIPAGTSGARHRTETLDYVMVLSGEIDMELDASVVKLKAGDVMVQRGTIHRWVNRGTQTARVAFVLVDAEPLGIGQPVIGTVSSGHR